MWIFKDADWHNSRHLFFANAASWYLKYSRSIFPRILSVISQTRYLFESNNSNFDLLISNI